LVIILFILIAFEFQAQEKIGSKENTHLMYRIIEGDPSLTILLPEGELVLLPLCGLMPQEEKPNEVAQKLEEFLKNLIGNE